MDKKKIIWIILLILIVVAIVVGIVLARPQESPINNADQTATFNKNTNTIEDETKISENKTEGENKEKVEYQKTELEDGILYSVDGTKVEADVVVGTNYFDTTISDIYLNPQNYYDKKIEIEGMYLENTPYTFVGRYSTSNICPNCPPGYSYFEYQLDGTIDVKFTDEKEWIKVVGTLAKGNDETSNFQDYYYLNVINLEVMNERGQDTVNN